MNLRSDRLDEQFESGLEADDETHRRLLTVQEAARYLAVSVSTMYGWVWQRRISFVKVGKALRFDPSDLEAFVEANRVRPR